MTLWSPPGFLNEQQHNLQATPNVATPGVTATGGAANTKGVYIDLFASTNFNVEHITIVVTSVATSATRTDALLDIAVGGAGSEKIVLPDLLVGWAPAPGDGGRLLCCMPFFIPKGAVVRARCQGLIASETVAVAMWLYGRNSGPPAWAPRQADAYGVTAASSTGTYITPGATAGTEGTWTSVGSTTSRPYKGILPLIQGTGADTTTTGNAYHWEFGWGSTSMGEYYNRPDSTERIPGLFPPIPIFQTIPSGTQLQARAEQSGTDTQTFDVALYGLY